jgi:outer membrane receptor for ferrienterochelin and colicins
MLGGGAVAQTLGGDRYDDASPQAQSGFLFAQHEWLPSRLLDVNVSARLDMHSDYAARLSPKASVLVRPFDQWRLRASVGSGFKAPDFRQLYLSFTNAAAGYSVFGSTQLEAGVQRLLETGQVTQVFIDPSSLEVIQAEHSVAFNAGISGTPVRWLDVSLNAFRNNVRDLIETQPVAQKANGSFVYGYFNLNRMYTQGVETEATLFPSGALSLTAGYQFLQAHDPAVVEAIREGNVFTRDAEGRDRRVALSEYGGLFGRSKHSGLVRAAYRNTKHGLTLTLRGIFRGRYGYRDTDGNAIANRADEFIPGYARWNATVTKDWSMPRGLERLSLQVGADNLFDIKRPELIPSMPGRTIYAGFHLYL